FERTDIAPLPTDNTTLDFVVLDIEDGYRVFDSALRSRTLNRLDDYFLGLLGGRKFGLVYNILNLDDRLGSCLFFKVFDELRTGFFGRQAGNGFKLLDVLRLELLYLFLFLFADFRQAFQVLTLVFNLLLFTVHILQLLIERLLLLADAVFTLIEGVVLLVRFLFMFRYQLQEFFFGLQLALLLQVLASLFSLLQYLLGFVLGSYLLPLKQNPQCKAADYHPHCKSYNDVYDIHVCLLICYLLFVVCYLLFAICCFAHLLRANRKERSAKRRKKVKKNRN